VLKSFTGSCRAPCGANAPNHWNLPSHTKRDKLSGFVGILNLDLASVDRTLLERLTQSLVFRGPDAQEVWCRGQVGLGHALLQITSGTAMEKQPGHLDDRLWIVADARIDAREELIAKLKAKSASARELSLSTPDSQLILHAYDTWGAPCIEHLIGDFSFAIWDTHERRLFCARDQFGVKPFFYARLGPLIIFSNTLNCIRQHPSVSHRLNDLAIADFLMFDMNQDPATTSFADVQRLPAAHTLTCEREQLSVRRYWELSVTTPIHFSHDEEYVERFRELLDLVVADRLRTESAGVLMSGGLDSPTVAASAQRVFARNGRSCGLRAYTEVFDSLIPHEERHYASLVADALKIPIEFLVSDHWKMFERADQPEYRAPEPIHSALPNTTVDQLRQVAVQGRVALTGYGGDPALCGRISVHFRQLLEKRLFGRALADAARFLAVEGRLSRLYLRTRLSILVGSKGHSPGYPGWLNEDLEKRLGLRGRWELLSRAPAPREAVRPEAHEVMAAPLWADLFAKYDSGFTRVPVDVCHPIFDLRLVNFLLALPRLPWCSDKELLREAARGRLPDVVRLRRKSVLPADPLNATLQRPESAWVDRFEPTPQLEQYVVRKCIPAVQGERSSWSAWMHLRPLSLNFWLRGMDRVG
jgi:asparagine synthase (glutamine-hydrolysing)